MDYSLNDLCTMLQEVPRGWQIAGGIGLMHLFSILTSKLVYRTLTERLDCSSDIAEGITTGYVFVPPVMLIFMIGGGLIATLNHWWKK